MGSDVVTMDTAWQMYEDFVNDPRVCVIDEPLGIEPVWRQFSKGSKSSPKIWTDAYLAAFAVVGLYEFVTFDRAFIQFPGLNLHLLP